MKTKFLSSLILFVVCTAAALAANARYETPFQLAGSGLYNSYKFEMHVGDQAPKYYIAISTWHKISLVDLRVFDHAGNALVVAESREETRKMAKYQVAVIQLSGEQMERGAVSGEQVQLQSARGNITVQLPADEFALALREAAKRDTFTVSRKKEAEIEALAKEFNPAVAAGYLVAGTGQMTGQAFLKTRGGEVRVGAGNLISLFPDDAWTQRAIALMKAGSPFEKLPAASRDYIAQAIRTTQADAQGNFEFKNLPAGKYRLHTLIYWEVSSGYRYSMRTTGGEVETVVHLKDGESMRIMLTK